MNGRGVFITLEGGEGSGKSTQQAVLAEVLRASGLEVLELREPGGTPVGESVRSILLDPAHADMDPRAELLLYEAARAQLCAAVIEPALARGIVVICDRFFDSSMAYQGYGRGLPLEEVEALNLTATAGLRPDRTLLLDIDPVTGIRRATSHATDRLEAEDAAFHDRVRQGFAQIARGEPGRVRVIDASGDVAAVSSRVRLALADVPAFASAWR